MRLGLIAVNAALCGLGFLSQQGDPIDFPGIGKVFIQTSRPNHDFPTISFLSEHGRVLLRGKVGTDNPTIFRINPLENEGGRENPVFHYTVVHPPTSPPIVFAVAMYGGGSDCEYGGAAFGEHDGNLQPLFTKQVQTNAEGGMYFGDLGLDRGYGFAIWNFIWGTEGHASPHRYGLDLYHFDSKSGKFEHLAGMETKGSYSTGEEALAELGVRYSNLLPSFPDFGC